MKILRYIILLNLLVLVNSTYAKDNMLTVIDSTQVDYFYNNFNNLSLGQVCTLDTTTIFSSNYENYDMPYEIYQTLSNSGLAHKNITFTYPINIGFDNSLSAFSTYLNNDVKYPIVHQAFTEIKYMSGDKKEQHIEVFFSREFLPRFFITLNYDVNFSPGIYKRSKSHNSFFNGNFRYNTRNERYGVSGAYFHNKIDIQENGGIVYDSIFINNLESDKSVINVNLTNATNLIKVSGFVLDQYFNILSPGTNVLKDTINKMKINVGRINHHLGFQKNSYLYEDKNPLSSFYQNFDTVLDTQITSDSVCFYNVKNVLYWNTLAYNKYDDDIPFYLNLGIEHNFTCHEGYWDYLADERIGAKNYSNIRANAGIIMNLFKSTRITANAQIIAGGYHAGDFVIEGQWKQFLGTTKKNLGALKFDVSLNRQSPDWFEEYYYSNNFRWDNDFSPSKAMFISGLYELPFLTIGFKQSMIDNYIYFGVDAKPDQHLGTLSVSSLFSTFNLNLNKLEMVGFASLQATNNEEVVHIPTFQAKVKIAYNITLVKNNSMMQPSIAVKYFTKYYADAYMPALRTFYLQNDVKVGNFPYIDLCVTFKIKRANIYVLYTNMYSLTNDNRYITTPHYPMRDSRLCLGINWRLYK